MSSSGESSSERAEGSSEVSANTLDGSAVSSEVSSVFPGGVKRMVSRSISRIGGYGVEMPAASVVPASASPD